MSQITNIRKWEWPRTYGCAIKDGNLDELKMMLNVKGYLRTNCDHLLPHLCYHAARNGQIVILQYLFENGYDRQNTVYGASQNNHIECLKYAHENGCELNRRSALEAVKNGYIDCLQYIIENCPKSEIDYNIPLCAAKNNQMVCFKYCFNIWKSSQDFWNINYTSTDIVNLIDLDDAEWNKLLYLPLDLSNNPNLQTKIQRKICFEVLIDILPKDIIIHCIYPYL